MKPIYRTLRRLAEAFGPAAAEEPVAEEIRDLLGPDFTFLTTPHGNLVAFRKAKGRRKRRTLMVQAHMDELGFRPFKYQPDGFIQVSPLGGFPRDIANHSIRFEPGGARGFLVVRKEGERGVKFFVDVGAQDAEEARRVVPYHATGAYCSRFGMSETQLTCKSFDDRAGCALIADLLQERGDASHVQLVGVFTTREEFGNWPIPELVRTVAAAGLVPDLLINLEVCPGGPTPTGGESLATVGKGVGLVHMDRDYACPADVCQFMVELAESHDIPHQHMAMRAGGGELGKLAHGFGVKGYSLVVPGRYMHSPHSVISHIDFEAARALLDAVVDHF